MDTLRRLYLTLIVLLLTTALLSPQIDIAISREFYRQTGWAADGGLFFSLMAKGIPEFIVLIAFIIFIVWLWDVLQHKNKLRISTKIMLLTSGTMFLGPIVIVNGIFKSFWGRARPESISEFGGSKIFSRALSFSDQCQWDCSFMSGHAAVAFWTLSLALLAPQRYRPLAITVSVFFGTLMGIVRIMQGQHFFSDVIFGAAITVILILSFYQQLGFSENKKQ